MKDVWGLPHTAHTVYTRWLSSGHTSLREDLLARWPKFFRSLVTGPSPEVTVVARLAARDARSTTAANNHAILGTTGLEVWTATAEQVRVRLRQCDVQMNYVEEETAVWLSGCLAG